MTDTHRVVVYYQARVVMGGSVNVTKLRDNLEEARARLRAGDADRALDTLDRALRVLDGERLLTTSEAARLLGIRSVNTLKSLARTEQLHTVFHGNRMMVPLSEVERIQQSERVHGIRASDRMHDTTAELGGGELSEGELADLEAGRPGRLPWEDGMASRDRAGTAAAR